MFGVQQNLEKLLEDLRVFSARDRRTRPGFPYDLSRLVVKMRVRVRGCQKKRIRRAGPLDPFRVHEMEALAFEKKRAGRMRLRR